LNRTPAIAAGVFFIRRKPMDNPIKAKEYKGYAIKVFYDEDFSSSECLEDILGRLVCSHRKYNLGNERARNTGLYSSWEEWLEEEVLKPNKRQVVYLPLYLYDHSGITMSTTPFECRWDSGQVGYIYATKDEIRKRYNVKRCTKKVVEDVLVDFRTTIKEYDSYLRGDVYGFEITKPGDDEVIDSIWGYVGDMDYVISEAEGIIDEIAKEAA